MTRRIVTLVAPDAFDTLPVDGRDRPWLALAFLPACVAVAVYLATNPYPAYGAGLYAQIAAEIVANGYLPPATIPGYTAEGVPFAYPPLQFYAFAVLLDLGVDPVTVARFLPSVAVVGGAALAAEMTLASDPSTPEFLDGDDREAMGWIASETPPDATFVAVGDAAEWLPALTDRTLLVGPWGVEWRDAGEYERQLEAFETLSTCHSTACVESTAATVGAAPTHVYLPKGQYTVCGESTVTFGTLDRSFAAADGWTRVYENDGVVVYRSTRATAD